MPEWDRGLQNTSIVETMARDRLQLSVRDAFANLIQTSHPARMDPGRLVAARLQAHIGLGTEMAASETPGETTIATATVMAAKQAWNR